MSWTPGGKRLLVFFGMIASGKSYLANACAEHWGCSYYNSDVVRKKLAGVAADSRQNTAYDSGIYSHEFSRKTYDALIALARKDLEQKSNTCVILDASYQSTVERKRICSEFCGDARVLFIQCQCSEAVLKKRMEQRLEDRHAVSDGRWEIYLEQKTRFEPPDELSSDRLLVLDTDKPVVELLASLQERMKGEKDK